MSVPELRSSLDQALRARGVFDAAREVLRTYAASAFGSSSGPSISSAALPSDVFAALREAGLVDQMLEVARTEGLNLDAAAFEALCGGAAGSAALRSSGGAADSAAAAAAVAQAEAAAAAAAAAAEAELADSASALDPNRRYLRIELGRGRAFLSHLDATYAGVGVDEEDQALELEALVADAGEGSSSSSSSRLPVSAAAPSAAAPSTRRYYALHLLVNGARFRSLPVPATIEPAFNSDGSSGVFYVDVQPPALASLAPISALLAAGEQAEAYASLHVICTLVTHRAPPAASLAAAAAEEGGDVVLSEIIGTASIDWRGVCGEGSGELTALLPLLPPAASPGSATPSAAASATATEDLASSPTSSSSSSSLAIGLLPLTLRLLPPPPPHHLTPPPTPASIALLSTRAALRAGDTHRAFLAYARAWWGEYKALHPSFKRRLVRIFGEGGEAGARWVPLPSRLAAVVPGRGTGLATPRAAARFVSLLPVWGGEPVQAVGAGAPGTAAWRSLHAIAASRGGTGSDHALLLCSLFLGLGLDAHVCIGTVGVGGGGGEGGLGALEEEAAWVLTRTPSASAVGGYAAIFHDPTTGLCYPGQAAGSSSSSSSSAAASPASAAPPSSSSPCPFLRLACAFSPTSFYACTAGDDSLPAIAALHGYGFEDPLGSAWKGMEAGLLARLPHVAPIPLSPPTLNPVLVAEALEGALRRAWGGWRERPEVVRRCAVARSALAAVSGRRELDGVGLGSGVAVAPAQAVVWGEGFSLAMAQALAVYEEDRLQGRASGSSSGEGGASASAMADFAVAIKRQVPRGSAFRAFPIAFNHISPSRAWCTLLASPAAREIIETPCHADPSHTLFSLRVQVTAYPEDTVAAWVMLGVCTMVPTKA